MFPEFPHPTSGDCKNKAKLARLTNLPINAGSKKDLESEIERLEELRGEKEGPYTKLFNAAQGSMNEMRIKTGSELSDGDFLRLQRDANCLKEVGQPYLEILSSLLELQKCLNDLSGEKYDEYEEFSFQMEKSQYKRVLQDLLKLKSFQNELRKENDMMKDIAYTVFQVQNLS